MKYIIFIFSISIVLTGCTKMTNTIEEIQTPEENITTGITEIKINMTNKNQVIDFSLNALKESDMDNLAKVISKDWVSFSPYSYVDTGRQITLKKEELKDIFDSTTEYVRWSEDGTGDPMILTFKNYFKKYIYDIDFQTLAEKNYDKIVQRGNTINNIEDVYSWTSTIEYFIPGINPEYWWMDRRSLTLVFQLEDKEWKLRAIIHNQWTI